MIGNGFKWCYFGRLLVTGNQAIPNVLTPFNSVNFNLLTFTPTPDGLFDFDAVSGIFTLKRPGLVDIAGTLNIDSTTGLTEVEVITEYDDGGGFVKRNARTAELPVIGAEQTTIEGTLEKVNIGHRLKFSVRSPNASASWKTAALPDGSVVPAIILHMKLLTR
jgi:hypothetical protein